MKETPRGLGVFIWELSKCEGGDVREVANKAILCGVDWLAVKSGDDNANGQLTKAVIDKLHSAGLFVYAWYYSSPGDAKEQAQIKQAALDRAMGVDGVMVDAEEWWEQETVRDADGNVVRDANGRPKVTPKDMRARAAKYAQALRLALGDECFIGDCGAWQWPKYHRFFPDVEFGRVFDARMPERYWTNFPSSYLFHEVLKESEYEWTLLPAEAKPLIIPIGSAFDDKQPARDEDVLEFIDRYGTCALWSWQHMKGSLWQRLAGRAAAARAIKGVSMEPNRGISGGDADPLDLGPDAGPSSSGPVD